MRCAGIPATRCATLNDATPTSLSGVSSTAAPVTATRALANTSPGKPPWPVKLIAVEAPPASGPSVHVKRVWSPFGASVQPDDGAGASNTNGTSPAKVASSDAPGAATCVARFATVSVQVVGVSSVTGFGEARIVT